MRSFRLLAGVVAFGVLAACSVPTTAFVERQQDSAPTSPGADNATSPSAGPYRLTPGGNEGQAAQADLQAPAGPFGADFDANAAAAAAKKGGGADAESWAHSIVAAVHGDYRADVAALLNFTANIDSGREASVPKGTTGAAAAPQGKRHVAILLDASGSMKQAATPGSPGTRMDEARAAIAEFAQVLPADAGASLRVHGDQGSNSDADKATSCASTRVVYQGNPVGLAAAARGVKPVGWTPLAAGVAAIAQDIPGDAASAVVYVVSDGIETCGGDPVAAAKKLTEVGSGTVVNVIGFQVGADARGQLRAMATAGGGEYVDAQSPEDLKRYWTEEAGVLDWIRWEGYTNLALRDQMLAERARLNSQSDEFEAKLRSEGQRGEEVLKLLVADGSMDEGLRFAISDLLEKRKVALIEWVTSTRSSKSAELEAQLSTELKWVEERGDAQRKKRDSS